MNDPEQSGDQKLPVTAEVGGEGGSYADATLQAETFSGPRGNRRVDPEREASEVNGDATADAAEGGQALDDTAAVRQATEPPEPRKP